MQEPHLELIRESQQERQREGVRGIEGNGWMEREVMVVTAVVGSGEKGGSEKKGVS